MKSRTVLGLRWWTISLIMLGAILNFLTRSTLSVAVATPVMKHDLHITAQDYSYVLLAFQIAIMLQPIVGYILDRIGLRFGMAIFATAWSVICMAHGLATSWPILAGLRGALGFAEGSANPSGMKMVSLWFPANERGFAGGLYNIGASVGSMVAAPLVAWAILTFHTWQSAFYITGGLGFVWVFAWLLLYRSPANHPALSAPERAHIEGGQEKHLDAQGPPAPFFSSLGRLLRLRNFWGIALPRFLADPTWAALTFWLPSYLTDERHFDLLHIGMYAWMPFLAADLGCLFGPTVVLALQKLGVSLINARRGAFTLGALLMTGVAFAGFVGNAYAALALICLAGFAHQTLSVTVITMASDLFKRNEVATVAGAAGTFGNAGVMTFNTVIGALVASIGYAPFFVLLAVLDIIGAVVLWTLVRPPREDVAHA
jgi:ACS family hexuronate transporter-like MFS transporter